MIYYWPRAAKAAFIHGEYLKYENYTEYIQHTGIDCYSSILKKCFYYYLKYLSMAHVNMYK